MTPGSVLLQRLFALMAMALVAIAHLGVKRASLACGDGPEGAMRLARRFEAWVLGWLAIVLTASASGVFQRWDLRPPPFPFLALAIVLLGIAFARSSFGDRLSRGLPLAALVLYQSFRF